MQVFKTYFKVLNQHKSPIIMYIIIFSIVLFCFIVPNLAGKNEGYVEKSCNFAVFDYDETKASKAFVDYLSQNNKVVEIEGDEKEIIQDELYYRNITCALRIPKGFANDLENGNRDEILEVVTIPGTTASSVFESQLDSYLKTVTGFVDAGMSLEDAMTKAKKVLDVDVKVSLPDESDAGVYSARFYYYNYLAWIMICMMILGVCPVLLAFREEQIKNRIECSSYRFVNLNRELLLAVLVSGLGICALLGIMSVGFFGKDMLNISGLLNVVNLICYMLVALAIAFVISKLIAKEEMLNMAANIISLGMSFLCGIFVPKELLGENVIKIAHFLPAYWYSQTVTALEHYNINVLPTVAKYMGIELLFALAIVVLGLAVAKKQQMR